MIIDSARLNGPCSCGREHVMATKEAVIEPGCMEKLDFYAAKYGLTGRRAVVYDENTYNARNIIHPKAAQEIVLPPENLHANEIAVGLLKERLGERHRLSGCRGKRHHPRYHQILRQRAGHSLRFLPHRGQRGRLLLHRIGHDLEGI